MEAPPSDQAQRILDATVENIMNAPHTLIARKPDPPLESRLAILRLARYGLYGADALKGLASLPPSSIDDQWRQHMAHYPFAPQVGDTLIETVAEVAALVNDENNGKKQATGGGASLYNRNSPTGGLAWNESVLANVIQWMHLSVLPEMVKSTEDLLRLFPFEISMVLPDDVSSFWRAELEDANSTLWRYAYGALVWRSLASMPTNKRAFRLPVIAAHLYDSSWRKQFKRYVNQVTVVWLNHRAPFGPRNYNERAGLALPRVTNSLVANNEFLRQGLHLDVQLTGYQQLSETHVLPVYRVQFVESTMNNWLRDLATAPKETRDGVLRELLIRGEGVWVVAMARPVRVNTGVQEERRDWIPCFAACMKARPVGAGVYQAKYRYLTEQELRAVLPPAVLRTENLPMGFCAVKIDAVDELHALRSRIGQTLVALQQQTQVSAADLASYASQLSELLAQPCTAWRTTVYQSRYLYTQAAFPSVVLHFTPVDAVTSMSLQQLEPFAQRILSGSWREFHRRLIRYAVKRRVFISRQQLGDLLPDGATPADNNSFYWTPEVNRSSLPSMSYAPDPRGYLSIRLVLDRLVKNQSQFAVNIDFVDPQNTARQTCLADGDENGVINACRNGAANLEVHVLQESPDDPQQLQQLGSIGPHTVIKGNGYAQAGDRPPQPVLTFGAANLAAVAFDARDPRMQEMGLNEQLKARLAFIAPVVAEFTSSPAATKKRQREESYSPALFSPPTPGLPFPLDEAYDNAVSGPLSQLDNELLSPTFARLHDASPGEPIRSALSVHTQELQAVVQRPVVLIGLRIGNVAELINNGAWDSSRCMASLVDHDGYLRAKGIDTVALIVYVRDTVKNDAVRKARVLFRVVHCKHGDRYELMPSTVDGEVTSAEDFPVLVEHSMLSSSTTSFLGRDDTVPVHPNIAHRLSQMSV